MSCIHSDKSHQTRRPYTQLRPIKRQLKQDEAAANIAVILGYYEGHKHIFEQIKSICRQTHTQHSANITGSHLSWLAHIARIKHLLAGRFKSSQSKNTLSTQRHLNATKSKSSDIFHEST